MLVTQELCPIVVVRHITEATESPCHVDGPNRETRIPTKPNIKPYPCWLGPTIPKSREGQKWTQRRPTHVQGDFRIGTGSPTDLKCRRTYWHFQIYKTWCCGSLWYIIKRSQYVHPLPWPHKGKPPVLDNCSLTFSRETKPLLRKKTQKTRNWFWTECTRIKLAKLSVLWNFAVFNVNCPELALWVSLKAFFNITITYPALQVAF